MIVIIQCILISLVVTLHRHTIFFSEATGMFTILSMVLKDHLLLKSLRMITYKVLHVIPAHFGILF